MNAKNSFYDKLFRAYQDDTILLDEFLLLDDDILEPTETEERNSIVNAPAAPVELASTSIVSTKEPVVS